MPKNKTPHRRNVCLCRYNIHTFVHNTHMSMTFDLWLWKLWKLELTFTFAICFRPSFCLSVCRLSVTFVHPTQAIEIFSNVSTLFGTWPSVDFQVTRKSSGDEIANVNFLYDDIVHVLQNTIDSYINSATDWCGYGLECMFTKFSEITQHNSHYAVQGHSRSPILVPIESSYTTSY